MARDIWFADSFYVDLDSYGQLRIVGPQNHLHFGSTAPVGDLVVNAVTPEAGAVRVSVTVPRGGTVWAAPAMGHIRRVRIYTDRMDEAAMPFAQVAREFPADLAPQVAERTERGFRYRREYGPDWYQAEVELAPDVVVTESDGSIHLKSPRGQINFDVIASGSAAAVKLPLDHVLRRRVWPVTGLSAKRRATITELLEQSASEIEHLVQSNKTSGFDYGTVFPRDWMESADLGAGDLTDEAIAYMYHKALEFTSGEGVGWHENIVGEYRHEKEVEMQQLAAELAEAAASHGQVVANLQSEIRQMSEWHIARHMIDIEPRYLLVLQSPAAQLLQPVDWERLRRTARFVMTQARDHHLITFKRLPTLRFKGESDYEYRGNWRDSVRAFKMVHPVIAPYDVNAVFYPLALELIAAHADELEVNAREAQHLAAKWRAVKRFFRYANADGSQSYALALYNVHHEGRGVSFQRLDVNHLDEAYDLFYADPSEAQVAGFARRLLDPAYFYTPSGPTVVGAGDGYTAAEYHGVVIWTKQTAFAAAGLDRMLGQPQVADWAPATRELVTRARDETVRTAVETFARLQAFPELHIDVDGEPRLYTDQPRPEGTMNKVQLWSAVGGRRLIQLYLSGK